jgi:predicted metal-dependent peptidase
MSSLRERFVAARVLAGIDFPYLSDGLYRLHLVEKPGIGTAAVDKHFRVYVDPAAVEKWNPNQFAAVLVHEMWHPTRLHFARAKALGIEQHPEWGPLINTCEDAEINDDPRLQRNLPGGCILPSSIGQQPGRLFEEYFDALKDRLQTAPPLPAGYGGGSGSDGIRRPWEDAAPGPGEGGVPDEDVPLVAARVAQRIQEAARSQQAGSIPGGWLRWAEAMLAPPRVPWERVLAGLVRKAIRRAEGAKDYTYDSPNRRQSLYAEAFRGTGLEPLFPASVAYPVWAGIVLDTSGSMDGDLLAKALSEVDGVLKACGVPCVVISCDAMVHAAQKVKTAKQVIPKGGGGTDMGAGIRYACNELRPPVIVVVTDGYTPWPDRRPPSEVVVCLVGRDEAHGVPQWARAVLAR